MISYSQQVKDEIMKIKDLPKLELLSEIRAVINSKNSLYVNKIELKFENIIFASRFYGILQEITDFVIGIKYSISKKFGEHKVYIVTVERQVGCQKFLDKMNSITTSIVIGNSEILRGTMRGYFLYSGYVKNPVKEYAMDFFMESEKGAKDLHELLVALEKKANLTLKKNKPLIYIRNSEDIMDLFVLMGAMKEFYNYEEVTMTKDFKNKKIREMNWEVANETKILSSANRQIKMIEVIEEKVGIFNLTSVLAEAAQIRLKYPESSMQEISEMLGISKSGIKNRFRRLENIYKEITSEEGAEKH
ncbi:MAG: DNA-binding protein WhiA [Fusobacteriaceae bacterium]